MPILVTAMVVHDGAQRDVVLEHEMEVSVGDRVELHVPRQDRDATYTLGGLPRAAVANTEPDGVAVSWVPTDADVGAYDVIVDVSQNGEAERKRVHIVVDDRGHQLFVPGAITSLFVPNDLQDLGAFAGGGLELVLYEYAHQGSMWIPGHGRFYVDAIVLGSSHAAIDPMFSASLGFDLSLEQSPGRRFLLPFVGAQLGVAFQKQEGTFGWAMPLAGIYFWSSRAVRVALQGGYLMPTTASQDVRGVDVMALVDVAPF